MHSQHMFNECIAKTSGGRGPAPERLPFHCSLVDGRRGEATSSIENADVRPNNLPSTTRPLVHNLRSSLLPSSEGNRKDGKNSIVVSTYFPAAHTEQKLHHIGLLLLLKLLDILESTHLG